MAYRSYSSFDDNGLDNQPGAGQALASFAVPLYITGDDENTFRVKNKSLADWQRRMVIDRVEKALDIQCLLEDVVHGSFTEDGKLMPATLMVFKFRVDPKKHSRRIIRALINIEFFAMDAGDEPPSVHAIAPDERWSVVPTTDHEEITTGGRLTLGLSSLIPIDLGGEVTLEKTTTRDISDATTVTGSIHHGEGIDSGDPTACAWALLENKTRKTGVPDSLKVGIVLKRKDEKPFKAAVNVEARADLSTRLEWMFSKVPLDDPVLFNPDLEPAGRERPFARDALGTNLDCVADVTFRTVVKDAIKGK